MLKSEIIIPRVLKFHGKNFSNQAKLLSYGHTPVYLEVSNQEYIGLMNGEIPFFRQPWKRITSEVEYIKGEEGLEVIFEHCVSPTFTNTDHVFFAYIYPYTFSDMLYSIREVEYKCKQNEKVFFECKELVKSLENRPMY